MHHAPSRFAAIMSDIDGCLAPESTAPFNAAALARLAEHNRLAQTKPIGESDLPVITLCSGRPQPFAEAMCRLLGNRSLPCIAENGVWMYDPRTNHYDMDPAITRDDLDAVASAQRWVRKDLEPQGVSMQPGKAASVSLYHPDTKRLHALEPMIRERFARERWPFRVSLTWFYINCDLNHISKASAIDRFMKQTGLTRDHLAGIGDTMGDVAIADRVAFFACPDNAMTDLKPRAHYVSPHEEAEGVLDIVARVACIT
jgi:hydroxymethylpyrimidine pyrophosphatase-like HAD family hydrolase